MAVYPSAVKPFTTKQNVTSIVYAGDVNDIQDEVVAIETILGVNPQGSSSTVKERIAAEEAARAAAVPWTTTKTGTVTVTVANGAASGSTVHSFAGSAFTTTPKIVACIRQATSGGSSYYLAPLALPSITGFTASVIHRDGSVNSGSTITFYVDYIAFVV